MIAHVLSRGPAGVPSLPQLQPCTQDLCLLEGVGAEILIRDAGRSGAGPFNTTNYVQTCTYVYTYIYIYMYILVCLVLHVCMYVMHVYTNFSSCSYRCYDCHSYFQALFLFVYLVVKTASTIVIIVAIIIILAKITIAEPLACVSIASITDPHPPMTQGSNVFVLGHQIRCL